MFTVVTPSHNAINSWSSSIDWIGHICEIHLFCPRAFITEAFFPFCFPKQGRGNVFGRLQLIQPECQKLALSPLPTATIVEALKRSLSVLSQEMSNPVQGCSVCCHLVHNHRSLSARAKRSRSSIPKPPRSLGAHVVIQLTGQ
jgi:hypothetical protein